VQTPPPSPVRRYAGRAVAVAVVLISFWFVALQIRAGLPRLAADPLDVSLGYFALSLVALFVNYLLAAFGWKIVFTDRGEPATLAQTWTMIFTAQLGRYVPGKVWLFLGQAFVAEQLGFRKATAVMAILAQNICGLAAAVLVLGLAMFPAAYPGWLAALVTLAGVVAVALVVAAPQHLETLVNRLRARRGQEPVAWTLSRSALVEMTVTMSLAWVALCVAFALLARSFTPLAWVDAFTLGAAFNLAYQLGYYVLIVPGGLGVREGSLSYLIAPVLGSGLAGVLALVQRLWVILAELIALGIALAILGRPALARLRAAYRTASAD
jgi:glycosyltransferase 2 family protein